MTFPRLALRSAAVSMLFAAALAHPQSSQGPKQDASAPADITAGQDAPKHSTEQNIAIHLDPANTQIRFTLKSLMHDMRGSFKLKGGAVAVDPHSGLAQGEILVDATTGETGKNAGADSRMQKEVLDSDRYPSIFFHPEHIRGGFPSKDGSADVTADGIFNIHGADHQLTLKLHLVRQGRSLTATTRFAIPYVAWGMKNPSTTFTRYSKQVEVDLAAHGTIATKAVTNDPAEADGH